MSLKTLFAALATVVATSGCAVSFSPYGATIHADPYRGPVTAPASAPHRPSIGRSGRTTATAITIADTDTATTIIKYVRLLAIRT